MALSPGAKATRVTARCMAQAGWEYIPVEFPDLTDFEYSAEDAIVRIKREGLDIAYALLSPPALDHKAESGTGGHHGH